jgi:translocation and assembly module TamA
MPRFISIQPWRRTLIRFVTRSAAWCFVAALGSASAFAKVEFQGISDELLQNAEAHLSLRREPCDAPDWKVRRLFSQADREIRDALEVFGYYNVVVKKRLEIKEPCWEALFEIEPGQPVILRSVTVTVDGPGETDEAFQTLLRKNPLQNGQSLDHTVYENYKKQFSELASRRGYFDGAFATSRIGIQPELNAAEITLIFTTGERYQFGPIIIEQDVVHQDLVRRYIDFETGMPYDARHITRLYESLLVSGYFDNLDIRTVPRSDSNRDVLVTIRGTEGKARTYSGGIGYGTDTGPKLRAAYNNRRRNKQGHQSGAAASVSPVISEIGLNYRLPLDNPRAEWLSFDTGYKYEDTDTSRSKQAKFGIRRLKSRRSNWLETQFLDVAYEDFTVGEDSGTSFLLIPGLNWSQAISSGPPRPTSGHRVNLQISGTAEAIGSSVSFFQGDVFAKLIRPLWPSARVLGRVDAGFTMTNDFSEMPASLRYFAGGDFSVRGYEYQSLGPLDDSGQVAGGEHRFVTSVELDQKIAAKWSVAAFVDAGNAFDEFYDMDLKFGVGAGIRWYSPLGAVRVDVAFPLENDADDTYRLHITLGPDL